MAVKMVLRFLQSAAAGGGLHHRQPARPALRGQARPRRHPGPRREPPPRCCTRTRRPHMETHKCTQARLRAQATRARSLVRSHARFTHTRTHVNLECDRRERDRDRETKAETKSDGERAGGARAGVAGGAGRLRLRRHGAPRRRPAALSRHGPRPAHSGRITEPDARQPRAITTATVPPGRMLGDDLPFSPCRMPSFGLRLNGFRASCVLYNPRGYTYSEALTPLCRNPTQSRAR